MAKSSRKSNIPKEIFSNFKKDLGNNEVREIKKSNTASIPVKIGKEGTNNVEKVRRDFNLIDTNNNESSILLSSFTEEEKINHSIQYINTIFFDNA